MANGFQFAIQESSSPEKVSDTLKVWKQQTTTAHNESYAKGKYTSFTMWKT